MAGSPACQVHGDRAAVFTGTFFESGQSIMVCGECLVDFCSVIANPPVGEAALDEGGEVTTSTAVEVPDSPTPDGEPPSSESPGSSPDDTPHDNGDDPNRVPRFGHTHADDESSYNDESVSTPSN